MLTHEQFRAQMARHFTEVCEYRPACSFSTIFYGLWPHPDGKRGGFVHYEILDIEKIRRPDLYRTAAVMLRWRKRKAMKEAA